MTPHAAQLREALSGMVRIVRAFASTTTLGKTQRERLEAAEKLLSLPSPSAWRPNDADIMRAVDAYDAKRCEIHGQDVARSGMSERNKESIEPMIEAAILAALPAPPETPRDER